MGVHNCRHVVPPADRALEIVDAGAKRSEYLFANEDREPLSNMAMLELLQGTGFGEDLTVHGFRSTFKGWRSWQVGYPNQMSEMALRFDEEVPTDCSNTMDGVVPAAQIIPPLEFDGPISIDPPVCCDAGPGSLAQFRADGAQKWRSTAIE